MRGIFCWKNHSVGIYDPTRKVYRTNTSLKGVSDILGIVEKTKDGRTGVFIAVEVKTPSGKVSDAQNAFMEEISNRDGYSLVVRSVDELEEDLKEIL